MLMQLRATDPMVWSTAAKHSQHQFKQMRKELLGKTATMGKQTSQF